MIVSNGTWSSTTMIAMILSLIVDLDPKAPRSSVLIHLSLVIQRYTGVIQTCKKTCVTKLLSSPDYIRTGCGTALLASPRPPPVEGEQYSLAHLFNLVNVLTRQLPTSYLLLHSLYQPFQL